MNINSEVHIHTTFCDGKSTAEEFVLAAIEKGYDTLGFSAHSYTPFDLDFCIPSEEDTIKYINEIKRLQVKYADKIDILLGCEVDYFSNIDLAPYEYIIGSLHYIQKDGVIINIDGKSRAFEKYTKELYGGDFYAACRDYYELLTDVVKKTHADIIGHFDIVTKFNENFVLFDETDKRYINAAYEAAEVLIKEGKPFEMNSGAVCRKYKTAPYPAKSILKFLHDHGAEIMFSSDSHTTDTLGFIFDDMVELAKSCGYKYAKILKKSGFEDIKLI